MNCEQLIQHKADVLTDLKRRHSDASGSSDSIAQEAHQKTLRLLLVDLDQFFANFTNTFDLELNVWSNKQQPYISEMGHAFKRLQPALKGFVQVS